MLLFVCIAGGHSAALHGQQPREAAEPQRVAGRTLAEWTAELRDPGEIVRLRAVRTINHFGAESVPALTRMLRDHETSVRYCAAIGLGDIGEDARPAKAQLTERLRDPLESVRLASAFALARLGELETALPVLTAGLAHADRAMACSAAELLGRIGPPAAGALPALEDARQHSDIHVKGAALNAVRAIRSESE
ncbi:MAG: HEAT repeat domain-containing protein [Pirellulales bacterium]